MCSRKMGEDRRSHFLEEKEFIDEFYRPRTVSVLIVGIVVAVFYAFVHGSTGDAERQFKIGLTASVSTFIVYCSLQLRDGVLRRPHPVFWRATQGMSILYMMTLAFFLYQTAHHTRETIKYYLYPDLKLEPLVEREYASNCDVYTPYDPESNFRNVRDILLDRFLIAHVLGYWAKVVVIRDTRIVMFVSIFFEVLEVTFQHWLPNFQECWWDHLIVDILICNNLGIYLGRKTCEWLRVKKYNWVGVSKIPSTEGKVKRILAQFSPYSWQSYEWDIFSSPKSFAYCTFLVFCIFLMDMNGFFLKHVLFIPPDRSIHVYRLLLWFCISMPAVHEFFKIKTESTCERLGTNTWIGLAVLVLEFLISVKCGVSMLHSHIPLYVAVPWIMFFVLFPLWLLLFFKGKRNVKGKSEKGKKERISKRDGYIMTDSVLLNSLLFMSCIVPFGFILLCGCIPSVGDAFNNFSHDLVSRLW